MFGIILSVCSFVQHQRVAVMLRISDADSKNILSFFNELPDLRALAKIRLAAVARSDP
jgi:hypothetical protein